jgi:hypothetical protein
MGDIAVSTTRVEAPLEDILATEHAIKVHLSANEIDTYIACGDLAGQPTDGQLEIALEEQNDSGYEGTARLTNTGDGITTVDIVLGMAGTPEARPTEQCCPYRTTPLWVVFRPLAGESIDANGELIPHVYGQYYSLMYTSG